MVDPHDRSGPSHRLPRIAIQREAKTKIVSLFHCLLKYQVEKPISLNEKLIIWANLEPE